MRLANLVPSIPADLVTTLDALGIRTESDLLLSATLQEILRRMPPDTLSLQDLEAAIETVAELSAAPGESCFNLLAQEAREPGKYAPLISGNEDIDRILSGLGRHKLVQISGDKGSGKSVWPLLTPLRINLINSHSDPCLESCCKFPDFPP
jgi:RAD51-like protein 3